MLFAVGAVHAKSNRVVSYEKSLIWPAALRFLRVDEHLKITEKDIDAGYVLFELSDGKKTYPGALELSGTKDERARSSTRLAIKLQDRPSYMEEGLLDRLEEKLREELGDPVDPPKASEPKAEPPKTDPPKTDG